VMSSMKNQLGTNKMPVAIRDYRASGVASMMLTLRAEFAKPLSEAMLHSWHRALFEGYPKREAPEVVGGYRRDAIVIKSASLDDDAVRFEGPPARTVPREMKRFVQWFNDSERTMDVATRSALVHLYFESIHPYCDGNGRLGRALVSKVVAQSGGTFVMIPFSVGLHEQRAKYYEALHMASGTLDVTEWIRDCVALLTKSMQAYEGELRFQVRVLCLINRSRGLMNERQNKVFERMTREGARGFVGGMSAAKYQGIARTSKATATRDLSEMVAMGVLCRKGEGAGVRYSIAE